MERRVMALTLALFVMATQSRAGFSDEGADLSFPEDRPLLFVTHGTKGYDFTLSAKPGIDLALDAFLKQGWPVLYLNDCRGDPKYAPYMQEIHPTATICSSSGGHAVRIRTRNIFIAGGYFKVCAQNTAVTAARRGLQDQIERAVPGRPTVVLHYVLDAIYDGSWPRDLLSVGADAALDKFRDFYSSDYYYRQIWPAPDRRPEVRFLHEDGRVETLRAAESPESSLIILRLITTGSLANLPASHRRDHSASTSSPRMDLALTPAARLAGGAFWP
ncbi:MAG: hypothetical protein A2V88_16085 [Elusimicrobia bacterium RBG_16_66_12]|nr:MAG: hypothetical protein A2V88_16085 [Elusimicrobia bacterium RBG_16_66_12]